MLQEYCHGNNRVGVTLSFFVMYISGAKFEEHCSNTYICYAGDILDSVLFCFNVTFYDLITFLIFIIQKRE